MHALRLNCTGPDVSVDWSLPLLALGLFALSGFHPVFGGTTVLALLMTLVLHEAGHAAMARSLGVGILDIKLSGGASRTVTAPTTPGRDALIAAAGPATSLVLWAGFGTVHDVLKGLPVVGVVPGGMIPWVMNGTMFLNMAERMNLAYAVFTLLPVQGLDGGTLLLVALRRLAGEARARVIAGAVGLGCAVLWPVLLVKSFFYATTILLFMPSIRRHWRMIRTGR